MTRLHTVARFLQPVMSTSDPGVAERVAVSRRSEDDLSPSSGGPRAAAPAPGETITLESISGIVQAELASALRSLVLNSGALSGSIPVDPPPAAAGQATGGNTSGLSNEPAPPQTWCDPLIIEGTPTTDCVDFDVYRHDIDSNTYSTKPPRNSGPPQWASVAQNGNANYGYSGTN